MSRRYLSILGRFDLFFAKLERFFRKNPGDGLCGVISKSPRIEKNRRPTAKFER